MTPDQKSASVPATPAEALVFKERPCREGLELGTPTTNRSILPKRRPRSGHACCAGRELLEAKTPFSAHARDAVSAGIQHP